MTPVPGFVAEVSAVGPRIRRVVFDVPRLAEVNLPGAPDEALGIYLPSTAGDEPEGRNYTVRRRGPGQHQLTCDVVLHERGVASDWARRAAAGEEVVLDHARGWYRPEPTSRWQLLIADLAGLPALARILEELPPDSDSSHVTVIAEVADATDLAYLPMRQDISLVTTVGSGNGQAPSRLTELVTAQDHPAGRGYCWFAGEAQATREVRKHLRRERGWGIDQYDVVGYWRFDSETWDERYEAVSGEVEAVYARALADGKGDKLAAEEFDEALEGVGL